MIHIQLPSQSTHAYEVYCGPGAHYPAEANVPPVYPGGGPVYVPPPRVVEDDEEPKGCPPPVITTPETAYWPEEWYPRSVVAFARRARANGWDAKIGFSRGYVAGQAADSWELRDMISVWMDGYGKRAHVLWERNPEAQFTAKKLEAGIKPGEIPSGMAWKPQGGSIMLAPGISFPWPNLTEMDEWVTLHGAVLPSWYTAVKERYYGAQARSKANADSKAEAGKKARADAAHEDATSDTVG